jgi:anti-sigma28 factor (negative regulator of flagellin synthesis)
MKVEKRSISSSYSPSSAGVAYSKNKSVSGSAPVRDSIEVSQSANLFQKAVDLVNDVPDVRTEAIEGIQQELDDGSYHRDEVEVAGKVLQDYLTS